MGVSVGGAAAGGRGSNHAAANGDRPIKVIVNAVRRQKGDKHIGAARLHVHPHVR
jgi:hypothetical protein